MDSSGPKDCPSVEIDGHQKHVTNLQLKRAEQTACCQSGSNANHLALCIVCENFQVVN